MKRILALLFLWALGGLARAQEPPVRLVQPLPIQAIAPGNFEVRLTSEVLRSLESVPHVPIVYSYLRFVAPLKVKALFEANVLDSMYVVDLNGNRIIDQVSVRERDGGLRLDLMKVETLGAKELGPQAPYRDNGSPKRYFLDPYAPEFMVLFYDPPLFGLELQHHGYRPTVEEVPNPSLQIFICEPCPGPSGPRDLCGEPTFKLAFNGPEPDKHLMFVWEPALFTTSGLSPQWMRASWFCQPLTPTPGKQDVTFRVDCSGSSSPVYILAQVNYALQNGIRLRTRPVWQQIWPGATK